MKWQAEKGMYHMHLDDEPEWMDDLDWDHHYDKPGHDEVLSIEIVDE